MLNWKISGKERLSRVPFAAIGVSAYVAGFALPSTYDWPLILLSVCGFLSVIMSPRNRIVSRSMLLLPVCLMFCSVTLSALIGDHPTQSAQVRVAFLPAGLIFLLLSEYVEDLDEIRAVFLSFAVVSLGLSMAVLWNIATDPGGSPEIWVVRVGSPILVVPNDLTILAIAAPMSLVLLLAAPRSATGCLCALSLLSSLLTISVMLSRTAVLTVLVSLVTATVLLNPRRAGTAGLIVLALLVALDGLLGFPLLSKFTRFADARIPLWLAAWSMFLDAPLLGHGQHSFAVLHQSYLAQIELPAWVPVDQRLSPWAHNLYLEMLAEQGLIGFCALIFLLVGASRLGWQLQSADRGKARAYAVAAFAGLAGFGIAAILELSFLRLWVAVALFSLMGIIAQLSRSEEA